MNKSNYPAVEFVLSAIILVAVLLGATGCRTAQAPVTPAAQASPPASLGNVRVNPGDVLRISFPGAPTLNTEQRVEINGDIRLPLVGDVPAAGKTPAELQADLSKRYASHIQVPEVLVLFASSSASVFVSGAVANPGRIPMLRPMTVLEAIMEVGGFDPKRANVRKVTVIRQQGEKYSRHPVNLRPVLSGEDAPPFWLQPFDMIYVPEKMF